jgi:hypothetical protein
MIVTIWYIWCAVWIIGACMLAEEAYEHKTGYKFTLSDLWFVMFWPIWAVVYWWSCIRDWLAERL